MWKYGNNVKSPNLSTEKMLFKSKKSGVLESSGFKVFGLWI
jgi:hypothetical protein